MDKQARTALLLKVTAYFAVVLAGILTIAIWFPHWQSFLPFGGIGSLEDAARITSNTSLKDTIISTRTQGPFLEEAINLLTAMIGAADHD